MRRFVLGLMAVSGLTLLVSYPHFLANWREHEPFGLFLFNVGILILTSFGSFMNSLIDQLQLRWHVRYSGISTALLILVLFPVVHIAIILLLYLIFLYYTITLWQMYK